MTAIQPIRQRPEWELLPFRFERIDEDDVVLTNLVGEHAFVTPDELVALVEHRCSDETLLATLEARHIVRTKDDALPLELLGIKLRTRQRRLADSTGLHIFVVTLRCEHSCRYCQVSRQPAARGSYDMSIDHAEAALRLVFRSPNPTIKIEFQGGEPLLNFGLIRHVVERAIEMNEEFQKDLAFVMTTNLALLDDAVLDFCAQHRIDISTSLDGPADLHNANRPRPGADSWERTADGIARVHDRLGPERLSALMTTTERGLDRVEEIIATYARLGLRQIFLRPISPFGFALRRHSGGHYEVDKWLDFYRRGLAEVFRLNAAGTPMVETFAAIVAKKMLTNDDPGYVDLSSPAGIGIGAIVYNYDGYVYASDEARMLAEVGDTTFRLGHLDHDDYESLMLSDALLGPLEESFPLSAPMCTTCAFEPWCGADPVYHHATQGDAVGRKPESGFCRRNKGIFSTILRYYRDDVSARELLWDWAHR